MKSYVIKIGENKKIYSGHLKIGGINPKGDKISFTNYYMELNGKPYFGIAGEFHYSRYPCLYWEQEISKMKAAGINIISSYIFWIHHEEEEGIFDWAGDRNLRYFVELCAKHDMYVILRVGPFNHGEVRNGGLPDWLYGRPFCVRSNDIGYLHYVRRLYNEIGKQVSGILYYDNGPVIGIQLENEYMAASAPWEFLVVKDYEWISDKREGEAHIRVLKELAVEAGLIAPIYTCTSWDKSPVLENETLPLSGGYSFCPWNISEKTPDHAPTREYLMQNFHDNNFKSINFMPSYTPEQYPYSCCELGGGMACWYKYRFVVTPESVEAATLVKIAGGCNFIGYYMFHDGTNPVGKHSYLNERVVPKLSYNFQAPIGEFGQIRKSCKALKPIFYFLKEFEEMLCPMGTILPEGNELITPEDNETLRYAIRQKDGSGFIFLVNFQDHYEVRQHEGISLKLLLKDEEIELSPGKGFNLRKNVSAILPFNLKLEDILLKYSTAQVITSISDDELKTYFFYIPEGMDGEYMFDHSTIAGFDTENCEAKSSEGLLRISVKPESIINLTSKTCRKIRIITLSRTKALGLWKYKLWGKDRIILSEADIFAGEGYIEAVRTGNPDLSFSIYPPIGNELSTAESIIKGRIEGIFETFSISLAEREILPEVNYVTPDKAVVRLKASFLKELNEVYLNVDYSGNVGNAFIDGKLVHDNFFNGEMWEIGLKRLGVMDAEKEIYFHIIPYHKGSDVIFDQDITFRHEFSEADTAKIHSIKAVPEYKIKFMLND